MTEDELEEMFRGSFADHATEAVPVTDPVTTAHAGARRRRRVRAGLVIAAATVVIVPTTVIAAAATREGDAPAATPATRTSSTSSTTSTSTDDPGNWRVESYRGVELRVPREWGWGSTPQGTGGEPIQCGTGAFALPSVDGHTRQLANGDQSAPYVGRPVGLSDLCQPVSGDLPAHVWFASPLPVGATTTQTTVRVHGLNGFNVTVADVDAVERAAILASIRKASIDSNGCPAQPTSARSPGVIDSNLLRGADVLSLSVCVYTAVPEMAITRAGVELLYSTRMGAPASGRAADTIYAEPPPAHGSSGRGGCPPRGFVYVDLRIHTTAGLVLYTVDGRQCPGTPPSYLSSDADRVVSKQSVSLWAVEGVAVYTRGPGEGPGNVLTPFLPSR